MKESDPVRQMKENLDILMNLEYRSPSADQKAQGVAALEQIIELCISLDLATDFHKMGGFRILVPLLGSGANEFRAQGAQLIGELAQNHSYCQKALYKANVLGILLQLVDLDSDQTVKTKALFAVSCLIRNDDELEKEFVKLDGFSYLLRATMSDNERLSTKASFLLSMILGKPENKDKAIEIGMINQLITMLGKHEHSNANEQTTAALLALVEDCPKAIEVCRKSETGLKKILEDRSKAIASSEADEEELEHIKRLEKIVWPK